MTPEVTYTLAFAMASYLVIICYEAITSKRWLVFAKQFGGVAVVATVLSATTSFPRTKQSFGGFSPELAILIMLLCIVLGMAAHYLFYFRGSFSWLSFSKPFCVSPIVLLPLLGSVQGVPSLESLQLISLGFLAFQNGFFWRAIFENAKSKI